MYYNDYVSVQDQKYMANQSIKRLEKSLKRKLEPIILPSSKLATSWWGKMWNTNLERYAEYSNRIDRGKTYVRNGLVIDLQISESEVRAYVQGKTKTPYQVAIFIKPSQELMIDQIKQNCQGKLDTIEQLLDGQFSKEIANIFFVQGRGLFPEPKEIKFGCSCPDATICCKHIAAALYGIGSKLDSNPMLFFTLRGINLDEFLKDVVISKSTTVLDKGKNCKSNRIIENADIKEMFDINIED